MLPLTNSPSSPESCLRQSHEQDAFESDAESI